MGNLALLLILEENAFSFSPLNKILVVYFLYMKFTMLRYVLSIPSLWRVFVMKGRCILSDAFLHLLRWSCYFLHLFYWCYMYIDLHLLNHPCTSDKFWLVIVYKPFNVFFGLPIFCWEFFHLYSLGILVVWYPYLVLVPGTADFIEWVWKLLIPPSG